MCIAPDLGQINRLKEDARVHRSRFRPDQQTKGGRACASLQI